MRQTAFGSAASALQAKAGVQGHPVQWNRWKRFGFRFSFCYYAVWITLNGNATVWKAAPVVGLRLEGWFWDPLGGLAMLLGRVLFGLHGPEDHWISRGSSDTLLAGLLTACWVVLALTGACVWSLLDRRRESYQTLLAWLRFALRLTLGICLLQYGIAEVFSTGAPPLDYAALNTPAGALPPAALVWLLLVSSRGLQITFGIAELVVGATLLLRRTALFGALVAFFALGAVLSFEAFFQMPVRIFTGHVLLAAGSIILIDLPAVVRFFWKHQPGAPAGVWVPPELRTRFRRSTGIVEVVFLLLVLGQALYVGSKQLRSAHQAADARLPLIGGWQVLPSAASAQRWLTKDGSPVASVWFNRQVGRHDFDLTIRSEDGRLWQGFAVVDAVRDTMVVRGRYTSPRMYLFTWSGLNRIALSPSPGASPLPNETLERLPLLRRYRLLDERPPLVNEFGYAR